MILLYHAVFLNEERPAYWNSRQAMTLSVFKRHILWLAKRHRFVSLDDYLNKNLPFGSDNRKHISLTFDDGYKNTFECVSPFLAENNIPATFFVTSDHLKHGNLLWFSYLDALCFETQYDTLIVDHQIFPLRNLEQCRKARRAFDVMAKSMVDPADYCHKLAKIYPIPSVVASKYQCMTVEQIRKAGNSDLLEIGGHTVTHPYLNRISKKKQKMEILENKNALSGLLGKPIKFFAYPGGEYNNNTIEFVKGAGYEAALVIIPKHLGNSSNYELERIGIYSHSMLKLQIKAFGFAKLARRIGMRVG